MTTNNGTNSERYTHSPLQHSQSFRLVKLGPGTGDDPLVCIFDVFSLDAVPAYEALSYAWGDPSACQNVKVGNSRLPVAANLNSALKRLRIPNSARRL